MDKDRLTNEFRKILNSELWQNCKILYVSRPTEITTEVREKDYFENFENLESEKNLFDKLFSEFIEVITDDKLNNSLIRFKNNFDQLSEERFIAVLTQLANN